MTLNANQMYYHWAPTDRRKSIEKLGLVPGKLSADGLWRPPYVCLAPYPQVGWLLSGGMPRGLQIASWDLWEVWIGEQSGFEELYFDTADGRQGNVKEIRVYERIFKRNVWYVGTREV